MIINVYKNNGELFAVHKNVYSVKCLNELNKFSLFNERGICTAMYDRDIYYLMIV